MKERGQGKRLLRRRPGKGVVQGGKADLHFVCAVCRERERKLEARNAAIQLSAEELEKKIQMKVSPPPPTSLEH